MGAPVIFDKAATFQALAALGLRQRAAFSASCAQRVSGCFINPLVRQERPEHVDLAEQMLDHLWIAARTGDPQQQLRSLSLAEAVAQLLELTADEMGEGRVSFQTFALWTLLHAGRTWAESAPDESLLCASYAFDIAWYVDRALHPESYGLRLVGGQVVFGENYLPDGPFQPWELERQRSDLAAVRVVSREDWKNILMSTRTASENYAAQLLAALESVSV